MSSIKLAPQQASHLVPCIDHFASIDSHVDFPLGKVRDQERIFLRPAEAVGVIVNDIDAFDAV